MPRCYILKKHVNQLKSSVRVKDSDGNTGAYHWQPKTSKSNAIVALKRYDTPINSTETSNCYKNSFENSSGKSKTFIMLIFYLGMINMNLSFISIFNLTRLNAH